MHLPRLGIAFVFALAWLAAAGEPASADLVRLANGGALRGEIDWKKNVDSSPQVELRTLTGAVIIVEREHVQSVTRRRLILEVYETRARNTPETIPAQWELADWCRDNRLTAQRRTHLQNIVRLDPTDDKAHKLLGDVRRNGEWFNKDEAMRAEGYVKHDGEFITPQQKELLAQQKARQEAEKEWHKKIRIWCLWAKGRNTDRRDDGLAKLKDIQEPAAVPALSFFLQGDGDAKLRTLFVGILSQIPGDRPVAALAKMSLHDDDATIRRAAFDAIHKEREAAAIQYYVAELQDGLNIIVCRAGAALGRIGDSEVVPQLVEALVTTHAYRLRVANNEGTYSFGANGSKQEDPLLPPAVETMLRTGQLPNGVIVVQPDKLVRTKIITVHRDHENSEVLAALSKLTGESLGYDKTAWRTWWAAQKRRRAGG